MEKEKVLKVQEAKDPTRLACKSLILSTIVSREEFRKEWWKNAIKEYDGDYKKIVLLINLLYLDIWPIVYWLEQRLDKDMVNEFSHQNLETIFTHYHYENLLALSFTTTE